MVWLMLALPAAAVLAGIATVIIAVRAGGTDAAPGDVRRVAQMQVDDLTADRRAAALALHGELRIDATTGALELKLDGAVPAAARLQLQLVHPSRAREDRTLPLVAAGDRWLGRLDADPDHAWALRLQPEDGAWRLVGRLAPGAGRVALAPALGPPS